MSVKTLKRGSVKALKRESVAGAPQPGASTLQHFNASTIAIASRQRTKKVNLRFLKQVISALFAELKIENAELGIQLVAANEMARVNGQFLQHKGSTDVITFDHSCAVPGGESKGCQLHGELFVCVDDAIKQAGEFKTSWQSEVIRYIVHGVLHLSGYDDLKPDLRRKMKREENQLVRRLEQRFSFAELSGTGRIQL
jgi:probable rRNA maturation factor